MFEMLTPQMVLPTVMGATIALGLSAVAQRIPKRWGWLGRSQPPVPPLQQFDQAEEPPAEQRAFVFEHPHETAARVAIEDEEMPREVERFKQDQVLGPRRIAAVKAGQILMEFMQAQGATGYFTVKEIDAWWRYCRQKEGLDYLSGTVVRGELSAMRNVWIGLKRLNGPEYRGVKARNEGLDRAVLYKIPSSRSSAGRSDGEASDATMDSWASTGKTTGKRPVKNKHGGNSAGSSIERQQFEERLAA